MRNYQQQTAVETENDIGSSITDNNLGNSIETATENSNKKATMQELGVGTPRQLGGQNSVMATLKKVNFKKFPSQ